MLHKDLVLHKTKTLLCEFLAFTNVVIYGHYNYILRVGPIGLIEL